MLPEIYNGGIFKAVIRQEQKNLKPLTTLRVEISERKRIVSWIVTETEFGSEASVRFHVLTAARKKVIA